MEMYKRIGFFLGPLSFIVLLAMGVGSEDHSLRVVAVALWMLIWWITEPIPIYITAMLPMVFFPALDIMGVKETFEPYANPIIFLFLGGFIIALAMEERKLHERIAFSLVKLTGTTASGIIFGFMASTALVAMWISNTATTVMMLPIALSVTKLLEAQVNDQKLFKKFATVLMLGIAYSASIGGTMTLIGTPPNLVFAGYYSDFTGLDFSFGRWMLIGVPVGLSMLVLGFLLLTKVVFPIGNAKIEGAAELFEGRWKALGKMNRGEKMVLVVFSFTVALWILLNPINELIGYKALNNTNIAMTGGLLMFLLPVNFKKSEFILDWKSTQNLPWGILILFGGGLTMATGLEQAGVIEWIANQVAGMGQSGPLAICIVLTIMAMAMTEVMSNVALVTVLLPVVFVLAKALGVDAVFLAVPVTLAASCAFMMPISTPPNAVVYSSGYISVKQMMRAGIWMNVMAAVVIVLFAWLLLY